MSFLTLSTTAAEPLIPRFLWENGQLSVVARVELATRFIQLITSSFLRCDHALTQIPQEPDFQLGGSVLVSQLTLSAEGKTY